MGDSIVLEIFKTTLSRNVLKRSKKKGAGCGRRPRK